MPIAAVRHADGFRFLKVSDFFDLHVRREYIHQHIAARKRNQPRAQFRAAHELKFHLVHCEDVAGHSRHAVVAGCDSPNEVPVRFPVEQPPVHDVNLLSDAEDFRFHAPECLAASRFEGKFCEKKISRAETTTRNLFLFDRSISFNVRSVTSAELATLVDVADVGRVRC